MSTFTKNKPLEVPPDLTWHWQEFRRQRAILRHNIHQECGLFWKLFPRQKRRILPVTTFTKMRTWKEPEPVVGLGFTDCLGLTLRWRVSSILPDSTGKKVQRMWTEDRAGDKCPSVGVLYDGDIVKPEDQQNYRERWNSINGAFRHYNALSEWFDVFVGARSMVAVPKDLEWMRWGGGEDKSHMSADDKREQAVGMGVSS